MVWGETVYLQAFSDPDANGSGGYGGISRTAISRCEQIYLTVLHGKFRPVHQVQRLYAWMPLLALGITKRRPCCR